MTPEIKAIIVDDEEFARSSLYFLLQENCPNILITGIAKSVAEAKNLLQHHEIDLVFLDIAMPGENGFELIPTLKQSSAKVVFTTAYDHYALKAIKANALDYLLKPIDIDELKEAVKKAINLKSSGSEMERGDSMSQLEDDLKTGNQIKKITLPSNQGYKLVDLDEVIWIEADSNYSIFNLANSEKITVSKVLKDYEEILPENRFFRVHKSVILNLKFVKEYNTKNGLNVVLTTGNTVPVSRRRTTDFYDKLNAFNNLKN